MIGVVATSDPVDVLIRAIRSGADVLVTDDSVAVGDDVVALLRDVAAGEGVGSASPVPAPTGAPGPVTYARHPHSPPPPSLPFPCPSLCLLSATAVAGSHLDLSAATVPELLRSISQQLLAHGWRHAASPGVTLDWDPVADARVGEPIAGWSRRSAASMAGDANTGLEAHRSWALAATRPVSVVVDGACMTAQPYTGTQHLVLEVTRWMQRTRPEAHVSLAVKPSAVAHVSEALAGTGITVIDRSPVTDADVVYRPYQMLFARELEFVARSGRRRLVGQLDMIGFANPYYHPSDHLFFFARNLQRHLMRVADGVTFISQYGLESAYAEVPDLDRRRLSTVSCGADPIVRPGALGADRRLDRSAPFLVCLSSTFWHKNRAHAIAVLAALVERHAYAGQLVIGGPEPYHGRSIAAEDALIASLPAGIGARVHRWGHIAEDEKWWLLAHADAVLYPSIVEGFGLVPFEAAAAGTPCLAFDGTAQHELLGGTGAVVDSWDPATWADRVWYWIGDPAASAATVSAVAGVAATHTWERCAARTWQAIDDALARPRRVPVAEDGDRLARVAGGQRAPGAELTTAVRFDIARGVPAVRRRASKLARRLSDRAPR